ncbi:MAG: cyclopropane-fatty-acyl-phospholipid synthase family protein [Geminicoccaceae bacterium]
MLLDWMLRRLVQQGEFVLITADGQRRVYSGAPGRRVVVRLTDRKMERDLVWQTYLAVGEGYMDGRLLIEEGTLYDLLALGSENAHLLGPQSGITPWLHWTGKISRGLHMMNNPERSRRNVAHHYDLSGELYSLFLDSERQYTCAYHPTGKEDLEEAQRAKERHIAGKLLVENGQRIIDLGCGWGALALFLAQNYDVDVTGVTLSREQYQYGNARAAALGLSNRVRYLHKDYREAEGKFDRVVSIGMLEHVGVANYPTLFRKIDSLLEPRGVSLVHSIGRMGGPSYTNAWIRKYIFPGGYIPGVSEVVPAIEQSGLWITDIEILRLHYAKTLQFWRDNFAANRDKAKEIYDERFCRMWEYYLIASQVFFEYQDGMNFQIQMAKERDVVPLTRDYMFEEERRLALQDQERPVAAAAE